MMFQLRPEAERIFSEALALPRDQRDAFVTSQCGSDAKLLEQVKALLAADARAGSFLESPLSPASSSVEATADPLLGRQIDRYTIVRRVGSGGMGTVYEARQDHPARQVALKVLQPSLLSAEMRRRFRFEAETLGRLDHPHIARVFDAGATQILGQETPYLVMELIADAATLTAYAAGRTVEERLELIVKICDAVQHGHQRGVIHRDLKPANILVTPDGSPKVIDFGVARVTDADVTLMTRQTATAQLVGTLRYMSPEQCRGVSAEIDTRCDVYALGVILFELLSGSMPYDLASATPFEAPRIICEQSPTRLSAVVPSLRGDLEVIVAKALEKDPQRRYASAAALADDIRRFLRNEPIVARPASRIYQARMFARRHRVGVSLVTLLFAALAAGFIVSAVLYQRAVQARIETEKQRDHARAAEFQAQQRRKESDAVLGFLADTLLAADPGETQGEELTVREALDRAAAGTHEAFADQPAIEAAVRTVLGKVYTRTGRFADAESELLASVQLLRAHANANDSKLGETLFQLASLRWSTQEFAQAEEFLRDSLQIARANHGQRHETVAERAHALAVVLGRLDRDDEAEDLLQEAIDIRISLFGENHSSLAICYNALATMKRKAGDFAAAEPLYFRALELTRLEYGELSPQVAIAHLNVGEICAERGRPDEAERHLRTAVRILQDIYKGQHQMVPIALEKLATFLAAERRLPEAQTAQREAVAAWEAFRGPDHNSTKKAREALDELLSASE